MVTITPRVRWRVRIERKHYALLLHPISGWRQHGYPGERADLALQALNGWGGSATLGQ